MCYFLYKTKGQVSHLPVPVGASDFAGQHKPSPPSIYESWTTPEQNTMI